MKISAEHIEFVTIEGLPSGSVFCDPITAEVLQARVFGQPDIQLDVPQPRHGPLISTVRMTLKRLVKHHQR